MERAARPVSELRPDSLLQNQVSASAFVGGQQTQPNVDCAAARLYPLLNKFCRTTASPGTRRSLPAAPPCSRVLLASPQRVPSTYRRGCDSGTARGDPKFQNAGDTVFTRLELPAFL